MSRMLDKLRADFAMVASVRIAAGIWNKGAEAAAGQEIARLVASKDDAGLSNWACYLARLALLDLYVGPESAMPPVQKRACRDCKHYANPGRAAEGHCGGREDLAKAYGKYHPLHVLPSDGGVSCARFAVRSA